MTSTNDAKALGFDFSGVIDTCADPLDSRRREPLHN